MELGNTFGLSKGDSTIGSCKENAFFFSCCFFFFLTSLSGPTSASNPSASKSKSEQAGKSVSHAEVSAKVEPEDW